MSEQFIYQSTLWVCCITTVIIKYFFMQALYIRKYNNFVYILYILIAAILHYHILKIQIPLANALWVFGEIYVASRLLYKKERFMLVNALIFSIYMIVIDVVTTMIFASVISIANISMLPVGWYFYSGVVGLMITISLLTYLIDRVKLYKSMVVSKKRFAVIVSAVLLQIGALSYIYYLTSKQESGFTLIVVAVCFLVVDLLILNLFYLSEKENSLEKRLLLEQQQMQMTYNHYQNVREKNQRIQSVMHDIRRHVDVVKKLKDQEKKAYIDELHDKIDELEAFFDCSNPVLNVLINDKLLLSKSKNINMQVAIQDIDLEFMNGYDITTIFSNLLDNAMEACDNCEPENRVIKFRMHTFKEYVVIQITNSMKQTMKRERGIFKSTKTGHMGIGLLNVEDVVKKYDGDIKYDYLGDSFTVKIILPRTQS